MVSTRRSKNGVALRAAAVARQRQRAAASGSQARRGPPDVYEEMLAEAGVGSNPEPARKRPKRPGEGGRGRAEERADEQADEQVDEQSDSDVEFEDVAIPAPVIQTAEWDSEDDEVLEDVDFMAEAEAPTTAPQTLELNLTAQESVLEPLPRRRGQPAARRKPLSRAERAMRLDVHKVHVLCLLAHAARRNRWCSRADVQAALRPLLTDKMRQYLRPGPQLSQFGQTESLKNGLQQAASVFRSRFAVTERGLRRALWADADGLPDDAPPADQESVLDADDFLAAAKSLQGSRDVGAQLFCALLRTAGVETRLVCSLQPLAFSSAAPTLPKQKKPPKHVAEPKPSSSVSASASASPLRRLGHPHAAAYHIPSMPAPSTSTSTPLPHVVRGESPFPVYWVEVLDVAHQKWQPVDPLVTHSQWRPARLEPPASDRANLLAYVVGFSADRCAKDITRRYAKAFNAKTRRWRVDGPIGGRPLADSEPETDMATAGHRWLRRALRRYRVPQPTDVDTIEDAELAAAEAREPMPRNLADFQHHPVYALERHLRRHEVLVPGATAVGTVAAGGAQAGKALSERIYRRRDVRLVCTADRWYRQGRVVLPNEIPAKWFRGRRKEEENEEDEDLFGDPPENVPAFRREQTALYEAPPVVDGRVPKNKFGNVDVYVPSMVPAGGVHVRDDGAARAAFLLGVDYAPALTGFRFDAPGPLTRRGRRGTAVLQGAVVAAEHADAVRAVLAGLADLAVQAEADRRTRAALHVWAAFLRGLRIRSRIRAAAEDRGEEVEEEVEPHDAPSDDTDEYDMVMDDTAGGFLVE